MRAPTRPRFTYANVTSTIALIVTLGAGSAYAATTAIGSADIADDSIQSVDIKGHPASGSTPAEDGTITTDDVKNGSLSGGDIKPGSIGAARIANDTLTGTQINESTLGAVPNANNAYSVSAGGVNNSALQYQSVTSDKLAPVDKWHYIGDPGEPAFENGWHNYDTTAGHQGTYQNVAYGVDAYGTYYLRGLAAGGTIGQPMFHLSGQQCPYFYHAYGVASNNAFARVTVQYATPSCFVLAETGSNVWVALDGVSWQYYNLEGRTATSGASPTTSSKTPLGMPPRRVR